jgi:SAM-dependent MidA family methyltransferase
LNKAQANIAAEIERVGVISFARFMELALYCPVYGYYEKEGDSIGRKGDYFTSTSVGELFGELLAFQFAGWLKALAGEELRIVEAGAHDGGLAAVVLAWFRKYEPGLFEAIQYWVVEPSDKRWSWQRLRLREFEGKVFRAVGLKGLSEKGARGVFFSNELLDAMPVHRFVWDASELKWFEWGVGLEEGRFVWRKLESYGVLSPALSSKGADGVTPPATLPSALDVPEALQACLPDGFTIEICPAAERWWREAAASLREGKLLTLDYGFESGEFLAPERSRGSVRAYSKHRVSSDVLANPGGQDITAHVDFGVLRRAGEQSGLRTEALLTQEQFLLGIVRKINDSGASFPPWAGHRAAQLQTLTHPEHLGRPFSVLIQSRHRP